MKKMQHTFLIALCLIFSLKAVASVDKPIGTFTVEKEITFWDTSRYKDGCSFSGIPFGKAQIDKRLKLGMTFEETTSSANGKAPLRTWVKRYEVTKINNLELEFDEKVVKAENIIGLKEGFETHRICELYDKQLLCNYKPRYPEFDDSSGDYKECSSGGSVETIPKVYVGKFKFGNGKTVTAYQSVTAFTGPLMCDGKDLGTVNNVLTEIYTNEVPAATSANYCGGYGIYTGFVNKNSQGKIILGVATELTTVP